MAKELPYFKFEPQEYLSGDISFCSLSAQGYFTNLKCHYWTRLGKLTKSQMLKRINEPDLLDELINENIVKWCKETDKIIINFLDEQITERDALSLTNSINGRKGGRPKKTEKKPTAFNSLSETKAKQKAIEENRIEENRIDWVVLLEFLNSKTGRKYKMINQSVRKKYLSRLKEGYTVEDIRNSVTNAVKIQYHIDNDFQYLTPEFFSRSETIEKYSTVKLKQPEIKTINRSDFFTDD